MCFPSEEIPMDRLSTHWPDPIRPLKDVEFELVCAYCGRAMDALPCNIDGDAVCSECAAGSKLVADLNRALEIVDEPRRCRYCDADVPLGEWCSDACRQAAQEAEDERDRQESRYEPAELDHEENES